MTRPIFTWGMDDVELKAPSVATETGGWHDAQSHAVKHTNLVHVILDDKTLTSSSFITRSLSYSTWRARVAVLATGRLVFIRVFTIYGGKAML